MRPERLTIGGSIFYRLGDDLYPDYLNHGDAKAFIEHVANRHCTGKGIDVGASRWPYRDATPVREEPHQNAYKLDGIADGSLDYVFSSHCLEHLSRPADALTLWISKLREGGVLFLYLPHPSMKLWNVGGGWQSGHQWEPSAESVVGMLSDRGMDCFDVNWDRDAYWSFHVAARKR